MAAARAFEDHITRSKLLKECQQVGIIPPRFRLLPLFDFAHREGLGLHGEVSLRVYICGLQRDMTQPAADRIDVHSGPKKVSSRRVAAIPAPE
jgi:hypothetical protein